MEHGYDDGAEGAFTVYCDRHCCALAERLLEVLVVDAFGAEVVMGKVIVKTRMLRKMIFAINHKRMMIRRMRQQSLLRLCFFLFCSGWLHVQRRFWT